MAELLAPAGSPEALNAAISEGADAVYLGLKSFNARMRTSNFTWSQFEGAVQSVHKLGKKLYITVNTIFEEGEAEEVYRLLSYINSVAPDGIIVQDTGIIRLCQEFFPSLELHASTQMNVESAEGANLLYAQGVKRVVVARELTFDEIRAIKNNTKAEIEIFVHGALCVSESGLCLFSSFMGGKSANRGMCAQACRRLYTAELPEGSKTGYWFSPCDLQLIDRIPSLVKAGIDSFKIEGRMKSAEYVGAVTAAYRYVLDNWQDDLRGSLAEAKRILSTDFARAKSDYWYPFPSAAEGMEGAADRVLNPSQAGGTGIYLGKVGRTRAPLEQEIRRYKAAQRGEAASPTREAPSGNRPPGAAARASPAFRMAEIRNATYDADGGDSIRLHRQDDSGRESHKVRLSVEDERGVRWIDIPPGFKSGDDVYLLQTKAMSRRYKAVISKDLSKYKRRPGGETLPVLDLTPVNKEDLEWFPQGLYVQVSTVSDAHTAAALNPVRLVMELNSESKYDLLIKNTKERPVLPYSTRRVIIALDPFVPEGTAEDTENTIAALTERGYKTFIANNLAHIRLLKKYNANIIGGPYLYTFNRWAASFLENNDVMVFQSPAENSEKNLGETFDTPALRSRVLLTVFSYPVLFRMRFKLPESYDFTYFTDRDGAVFKVNSTPDGSFVMPDAPFTLLDRLPSLNKDGWTRLLIDFSKTKMLKGNVKEIISIIQSRTFIDGATRFNWKDGFYNGDRLAAYKASSERQKKEAAAKKRPGKPAAKKSRR